MKKNTRKIKKIIIEELESTKKHQREKINIEKELGKTYFEVIDDIGILHTYDVAEGVAAMIMCNYDIDGKYWDIAITDKDKKEINASQALYWLTGGNSEWIELKNYKVDWHEASLIFKKKFSNKITRIVRKANTLRDIKDKFEKDFNLTVLYEHALKNNII